MADVTNFKEMKSYIYTNDSWHEVIPYVYNETKWQESITEINSPNYTENGNNINLQKYIINPQATSVRYSLALSVFNPIGSSSGTFSKEGLFIGKYCIRNSIPSTGYEGQLIFIYESTN